MTASSSNSSLSSLRKEARDSFESDLKTITDFLHKGIEYRQAVSSYQRDQQGKPSVVRRQAELRANATHVLTAIRKHEDRLLELGVNVPNLLDLIPLVPDWKNALLSGSEFLVPSYEQLKRARTELLDRSDGRPHNWPPNNGLHFRPLEFAYQGKAYRLTGLRHRLFEVIATAGKNLHHSEIVEKVWTSQDRYPERGTVRSCLSDLRAALRKHRLSALAKRIKVKDGYWLFLD